MDLLIVVVVAVVALVARVFVTRAVVGRMTEEVPGWGHAIGATLAAVAVSGLAAVLPRLVLADGLISSELLSVALQVGLGFTAAAVVNGVFFGLTPGVAIASTFLIDIVLTIAAILTGVAVILAVSFPWVVVSAIALAGVAYLFREWNVRRGRALFDNI